MIFTAERHVTLAGMNKIIIYIACDFVLLEWGSPYKLIYEHFCKRSAQNDGDAARYDVWTIQLL